MIFNPEVQELAGKMADLAAEYEAQLKALDDMLGGSTVPLAELELGVITTGELIAGDRFDWYGLTLTALTCPLDWKPKGESTGVVWLRVAEMPGRLFLPSGQRVSMVSAAPYEPEAEAAYENEVQP